MGKMLAAAPGVQDESSGRNLKLLVSIRLPLDHVIVGTETKTL